MIEWLHMGGHGLYIWGVYGLAALLLILEIRQLRARHRRALASREEDET
ncbi:heme exporter protein CcmD [Alkalilimnicola ehrlichii MLHE-1]|nr:heme exporter protein CcmD [Alkalilimnicola ehrlichii]